MKEVSHDNIIVWTLFEFVLLKCNHLMKEPSNDNIIVWKVGSSLLSEICLQELVFPFIMFHSDLRHISPICIIKCNFFIKGLLSIERIISCLYYFRRKYSHLYYWNVIIWSKRQLAFERSFSWQYNCLNTIWMCIIEM